MEAERRSAEMEARKSLYHALDGPSHEIRLVSIVSDPGERPIRLNLGIEALDDKPWFSALSYVWGNPNDTELILVNGNLWIQATNNLVDALTELSKSDSSRDNIWIDAICINQDNPMEKTNQVRMMSRIYKEAKAVIIWLGLEGNDSSAVFRLLNTMSQDLEQNPEIIEEAILESWLCRPVYTEIAAQFSSDDIMSSIDDLFNRRPYWTRVWTFQEVSYSRHGPWSVFVCGSDTMPCQALYQIMLWTSSKANKTSVIPRVMNPRIKRFLAGLMGGTHPWALFRQASVDLPNIEGPPWHLPREYLPLMVQKFASTRLATEPRDKLFGVADLVDLGVEVDYTAPVAKVYRDFAATQIKKLDNLSFLLEYAGVSRSSEDRQLPSWVPDWDWVSKENLRVWRAPTHGHPFDSHRDFPGVMGPEVLSDNALEITGVACDVVQHVMAWPNNVEDTAQGRDVCAIEFLFQADLTAIAKVRIPRSGSRSSYKNGITALQAVMRTYIQDRHPITKRRLDIGDGVFELEAAAFLLVLEDLRRYKTSNFPRQNRVKRLYHAFANAFKRYSTSPARPSIKDLVCDPTSTSYSWKRILESANAVVEASTYTSTIKHIVTEQSPFSRYKLHPLRTRQGYIGFARSNVRPGDVVCVTGASSMPLVLRRVGGHHVFVSNCFVLGLMDGEAGARVKEGALKLERFSIH